MPSSVPHTQSRGTLNVNHIGQMRLGDERQARVNPSA